MNEKKNTIDQEEWKTTFDKKFGWLTQENDRQFIDYSEKILQKIYQHEADSGAVFALIVGSLGGGKTGVTLSCIDRSLLFFPKEKVFFNECFYTPLQCTKLGEGKYNLMCENDDIIFFDRNKKKEIHPEVTYFNGFKDCYEKAVLGKANVIFLKDRTKIIDFLGFLRTTCEWNHVFIDEISECFPAFTSGESWRKIEKGAQILKDVRKTFIDVFGNTQNMSDIDPRVLGKIMGFIILPGAKPIKRSIVTKGAINNLREDRINGNEGYIEFSGNFCKIRFNRIYRPDPNNMIDARIKGEY
jgi:hypothetical protein